MFHKRKSFMGNIITNYLGNRHTNKAHCSYRAMCFFFDKYRKVLGLCITFLVFWVVRDGRVGTIPQHLLPNNNQYEEILF